MKRKGILVLAVHLVIVLSIAVKYTWERHHCPMVWTLAGQYDPDLPLRGRYLALSLHVDACGLSANPTGELDALGNRNFMRQHEVRVIAKDGRLTALDAGGSMDPKLGLTLMRKQPCNAATLNESTLFFISERAKPSSLKPGQQLWALVTVPPSGPPRPVSLALSDSTGWHPLDLR